MCVRLYLISFISATGWRDVVIMWLGLSNWDCWTTAKMLLAVAFTYCLDALGMTNCRQTIRNSRLAVDRCTSVYIQVHFLFAKLFCFWCLRAILSGGLCQYVQEQLIYSSNVWRLGWDAWVMCWNIFVSSGSLCKSSPSKLTGPDGGNVRYGDVYMDTW